MKNTTTRQIRRRLAVFVTVLGLAAFNAGPAGAESASLAVTGGSLSSTTAAISFTGVTLDGTDTTTTAAPSWTVVDARGTGLGWNVTVISTDLTDGGTPLRSLDISAADQDLLVSVGSISATAGNGVPTTAVGSNTDVPFTGGAALKILSAAVGDGMGTYTYTPTFTQEVPAEAYAVTYTGTVTVTVASTP